MVAVNNNTSFFSISGIRKTVRPYAKKAYDRAIKIKDENIMPLYAKAKLFVKKQFALAKYNIKSLLYKDADKAEAIKPEDMTLAQKAKYYLKKLISDKINPATIDKKLTKIAGKENVIEEPFVPQPNSGITMGRKKIYNMPDGKSMVLETYKDETNNKVMTRVYDAAKEKEPHNVVNPDGSTSADTFFSTGTGLQSDKAGLDWIEAAHA